MTIDPGVGGVGGAGQLPTPGGPQDKSLPDGFKPASKLDSLGKIVKPIVAKSLPGQSEENINGLSNSIGKSVAMSMIKQGQQAAEHAKEAVKKMRDDQG